MRLPVPIIESREVRSTSGRFACKELRVLCRTPLSRCSSEGPRPGTNARTSSLLQSVATKRTKGSQNLLNCIPFVSFHAQDVKIDSLRLKGCRHAFISINYFTILLFPPLEVFLSSSLIELMSFLTSLTSDPTSLICSLVSWISSVCLSWVPRTLL